MALFGGITIPDRPDPENIRRLDVLPLPMISQMQRYGMRIDVDHFAELSHRLGERMGDLRADIVNEIPPDKLDRFVELSSDEEEEDDGLAEEGAVDKFTEVGFNVESSQDIATLLYSVLGIHLDSTVDVKKTRGGKLSTGKKTLEQFKREFPVVRLILEYREAAKLKGTYADSMPRRARRHPRGADCPLCGRHHYTDELRVHSTITTTRTATGRTASKNPNLANIPARTPLGREIRAGFIPSVGHVFAQRDYAQIELRLLADRSGDPTMIRIYNEDGDIHVATAMAAFGIDDPAAVDKLLHRAPSKNVNFAVCYLITGLGLLDLMAVTYASANKPLPDWMDEAWCDQFIQRWFGIYPFVRRYLASEEELIRRYGIAWTRFGRVRRIPETKSYLGYIQEAGVRQGSNHGIQGLNGDLMKLTMGESSVEFARLAEYGVPTYPSMTIYDELLIETPEDYGYAVEDTLEDVMENVLTDRQTGVRMCKVPIKSDGKVMTRWVKE